VPEQQSESDDDDDDDDDDDELDMPTVELPPRVFDVFDAPPQPQASYYSPPTHSQVLEPTQVDDADARNEAATAATAEQHEAQADSQRASQKRRLISRSAAAMLDMEADEEDENGEIVKRGDDDDENDGDDEDVCLSDAFLDGEEDRHGDVRALHAQMEREAEFGVGGDGGFDDDGAEDGGAQAAKRRRRSDDGDLAASSDDGDDENSDAGAKAGRLSVPLNLREVSEDGAGDETGAGDGDGDAGHAGGGDESDEVDEATKQRFRERAQMRAAKHDFFATHADGLGRSQSNSLFPMLEEHSQHGAALARAVLLNESSQAAPHPDAHALSAARELVPGARGPRPAVVDADGGGGAGALVGRRAAAQVAVRGRRRIDGAAGWTTGQRGWRRGRRRCCCRRQRRREADAFVADVAVQEHDGFGGGQRDATHVFGAQSAAAEGVDVVAQQGGAEHQLAVGDLRLGLARRAHAAGLAVDDDIGDDDDRRIGDVLLSAARKETVNSSHTKSFFTTGAVACPLARRWCRKRQAPCAP
jgi:hypothetical protein